MITIQGKGVSAGVGVGPLYFYRRATAEIKRYTVEDTDAEWHRFKGAQTGAIEQLGVLAEQARKEAGDEAAMLFETHQMMAEDLDFEEAIEDRIVNQKMNAEAAARLHGVQLGPRRADFVLCSAGLQLYFCLPAQPLYSKRTRVSAHEHRHRRSAVHSAVLPH